MNKLISLSFSSFSSFSFSISILLGELTWGRMGEMTKGRIDLKANWPKGELTFGQSGRTRYTGLSDSDPITYWKLNNPAYQKIFGVTIIYIYASLSSVDQNRHFRSFPISLVQKEMLYHRTIGKQQLFLHLTLNKFLRNYFFSNFFIALGFFRSRLKLIDCNFATD